MQLGGGVKFSNKILVQLLNGFVTKKLFTLIFTVIGTEIFVR